jgi:ribose/xylose/arabinose/galactoside ABC-type transport system permease subunit
MTIMAEKTKPTGRRRFTDIRGFEEIVLLIILGAVIAIMNVITGGKSIAPANMRHVLVQSAGRGVAAIGQAFVMLTRGIDVSTAGIAFASSALGATMMTTQPWQNIFGATPAPVYAGTPAMLFYGLGLGALTGLLVAKVNVPPLIATLGMWQIGWGLGFVRTGGFTVTRMPASFVYFGQGQVAGFPVPGIIFITVAVVAFLVLTFTTYGKSVYATGGNPVMAYLTGIRINLILVSVYAISGLMASLGGLITTARVNSVSDGSFVGLELDSIAAAAIGGISLAGGRGNLIGVVIGVFILGFINNGLSIIGAPPFLEGLIKGLIILVAVIVDYRLKR